MTRHWLPSNCPLTFALCAFWAMLYWPIASFYRYFVDDRPTSPLCESSGVWVMVTFYARIEVVLGERIPSAILA